MSDQAHSDVRKHRKFSVSKVDDPEYNFKKNIYEQINELLPFIIFLVLST